MGEYQKAAKTCDRIIEVQETEWKMTEEVEMKNIQSWRARLLAKA